MFKGSSSVELSVDLSPDMSILSWKMSHFVVCTHSYSHMSILGLCYMLVSVGLLIWQVNTNDKGKKLRKRWIAKSIEAHMLWYTQGRSHSKAWGGHGPPKILKNYFILCKILKNYFILCISIKKFKYLATKIEIGPSKCLS